MKLHIAEIANLKSAVYLSIQRGFKTDAQKQIRRQGPNQPINPQENEKAFGYVTDMSSLLNSLA